MPLMTLQNISEKTAKLMLSGQHIWDIQQIIPRLSILSWLPENQPYLYKKDILHIKPLI